MADLTDKQQAFINHYLTCWNATEAARRAGYSEKTAHVQGSRLLSNVKVFSQVERQMSQYGQTANEVIYHLSQIARGQTEGDRLKALEILLRIYRLI